MIARTRGSRPWPWVVTLLLAVVGLLAAPAAAEPEPLANPRVKRGEVDGMPFYVVLPGGYRRSNQRYPVLYLLHPYLERHDAWLIGSDLLRLTNKRNVIAVLPGAGTTSVFVDGRDGSCRRETQLIKGVIPYVDSRYRTLASRAHRAIAGASSGGFSAMHLAARNPDRFAASASFSGPVDVTLGLSPAGQAVFLSVERNTILECGGNAADPTNGLFGNPLRDELWVHNANPADLAPNFRGNSVFVSAGTGQPCDTEDAAEAYLGAPSLLLTHPGSVSFTRALDREGVPWGGDLGSCGIHSWRYYERYLRDFWPQMTQAFAEPRPRSFDHRRADPRFRVWGWRFRADPKRAPEFLKIRRASRRGLTLTGSGTETVTTAPYYRALQRLRVSDGQATRIVRAGRDGRLTFTVDLGPPHTVQQYRPENAAAERDPDYFTTRKVKVRVVPRSGDRR